MFANLGKMSDQGFHDPPGHPLMEGKGHAGRRTPCPVQDMFHILVKPRQEIAFSGDVEQVLMVMAGKIGF